MSVVINPFVVSGKIPESYFCDRVMESSELEKSLTNQMNVVLTSSRRMGITRKEKTYSFSDPLLSLWLDKRNHN